MLLCWAMTRLSRNVCPLLQCAMISLVQDIVSCRDFLMLAHKMCYDPEALLENRDYDAGPSGSDEAQFAPLAEESESNMQTAITGMMRLSRVQETRRLLRRPSAQVKPIFQGFDIIHGLAY